MDVRGLRPKSETENIYMSVGGGHLSFFFFFFSTVSQFVFFFFSRNAFRDHGPIGFVWALQILGFAVNYPFIFLALYFSQPSSTVWL